MVLAGRRAEMLEETAALAKLPPPRILAVPTDVSDPAQIAALFEKVRATYGRIDLLFNNAGISTRGIAFEDLTLEQWSNVVAVNLTGSFLCAQHAFRMMKSQDPQGGRIINNGSISAHSPRPLSVAYTVSKHAMSGLTKSIELDGRPYGITCGQIDIGNTRTEIMDTIGVGSGALQADGSRRVEPMFPVEDAARAVLMMANMPASANVGSVVVTAAGMPFVGRG